MISTSYTTPKSDTIVNVFSLLELTLTNEQRKVVSICIGDQLEEGDLPLTNEQISI